MNSALKDKIIKITASVLILLLIFSVYPGERRVYAAEEADIDTVFMNTADSIYKSIKNDPDQEDIWYLYGLSIAGYPVKDSVLDKFRSNIEKYVKSKDGKLTMQTNNKTGEAVVHIEAEDTDGGKCVITDISSDYDAVDRIVQLLCNIAQKHRYCKPNQV